MTLVSAMALVAAWIGSTILGMLIGAELIRREIDGLAISVALSAPEAEDDHK